jgi:NAD(P)-dependent dehydrogenase (short-subunit alcohol dehydrogenase family)
VRRLDGKVALISGTARGMGRAAALEFAARGAMVLGCDPDEKASAQSVELVTAAGGTMTALAPGGPRRRQGGGPPRPAPRLRH